MVVCGIDVENVILFAGTESFKNAIMIMIGCGQSRMPSAVTKLSSKGF